MKWKCKTDFLSALCLLLVFSFKDFLSTFSFMLKKEPYIYSHTDNYLILLAKETKNNSIIMTLLKTLTNKLKNKKKANLIPCMGLYLGMTICL